MNAPVPDPMAADAELFKRGMRRLAAGVSVVTTLAADGPHGFAATAVASVSAEPRPSLLVCANRASSTHPRIAKAGRFCVNVLAEDDAETARRFGAADRAGRFAGGGWVGLATGAPALTRALASFDCLLLTRLDVHTHTVFVGEVRAVRLWRDGGAPLLYADGRYARLDRAAGDGAEDAA